MAPWRHFPYRPQDRGFQEVLIHGGGGVGQTPDYWGNDYFDDTYFHNGIPKKFTGYCTDIWFSEATHFIEANRNRPFFCYLATNAPHNPFHVPKKYSDLYSQNEAVPNANFYGMITNIDENIGHLLQKLKELNLEKNTILIFMTDNGTSGGIHRDKGYNAGMRLGKGSPYDGGHRVPCFIRWPKGKLSGGREINPLTAHIDLLPTMIDLCGLERPEGVTFDGSSLLPLLAGAPSNWPARTLFVDQQRIEHPEKWRNSVVMTDRWRLIKGQELYDIQLDSSQQKNISDQQPTVVKELREAYENWWEDVSKHFDEYCEIVIGSDHENPVCLTQHDLHGPGVSWSQLQVMRGTVSNGFWAVEIERGGMYEFTLYRWPIEANQPITSAANPVKSHPDVQSPFPPGKAIEAREARLIISDLDTSQPIPPDATAVTFKVNLRAGKTRLQALFINNKGESLSVYYVYVKRLPTSR